MDTFGGSDAKETADQENACVGLEVRVAALEAALARLHDGERQADTVPAWGTASGGHEERLTELEAFLPFLREFFPRHADERTPTAEEIISQIRASSTAEVVEVCNQIASISWSGESFLVRLSGIDWRVLHVQRDRAGHHALLLSDRVLGGARYHGAHANITWEGCDLRRWLNDEFCRSLGEPLASRAVETKVRNRRNPSWAVAGGNDTIDQFFLLSAQEAAEYLADDPSRWKEPWFNLGPRGIARRDDRRWKGWWLRSPGCEPHRTALVDDDGRVSHWGDDVSDIAGVRPAFWMDLES
ncbi:MAG: DUF6273 domain-containing protein [Micrococcales bacterium]|nr:DUF6273 domain-containing protein [Micrococcales bacterium]